MPRAPKISDEQLIELIEQGMNNAEIARQLDVPQANINTRCKQLRMRHEPLPTPEAAPEIDPEEGAVEEIEEIEEEKVGPLTHEEVLPGEILERGGELYAVIGKNSMGLVLRSMDGTGRAKGVTAEAFNISGFRRAQPAAETLPGPEVAAEPDPEVAVEPDPEDEAPPIHKLIMQTALEAIQEFEIAKAEILTAVSEGRGINPEMVDRYNYIISIFHTWRGRK